MQNTINYQIIHDNQKLLCFVGIGDISKTLCSCVKSYRNAELITVEDLKLKDQAWFNNRQFIVASSDVRFKINTVSYLEKFHAHFFSIVSTAAELGPLAKIGHGTCIQSYNSIWLGKIQIGNHIMIGVHNAIGHDIVIEDYSHVSHHSFLSQCTIKQGCVLGTRVDVVPATLGQQLVIPEFCNILSRSRISSSLPTSGTWYDKRQVSEDTSLTHRIL